ncbi:sugar phosphate permease [Curtobacterium sp. PhB191]|uniref:MFS transporter n=1 Tax=Curtobacterium sp. PhB191 TaxID=2485202 RepID=UPI00104CAAB7|nr:MFS transporter [Curtobacterium sp. PhB191]TCU81851.1 sugar phosphate permease [Curtobacterium sp. PhB191]
MTTVNDDALFRKVSTRVLPLAMIGFFLSYLDRVNIGFAQEQLSTDLGFSYAVYGLGAGLFFVGYFIFEIPSNLILAKVGARKWIARIMITWGLISGCMFLVDSETTFYVLRFLLGVAEAGFIPGVLFYMSQWFPASRRGRAWGIFYIALAASGVVGGPVSGFILEGMRDVAGLDGWQWLFIIEAIPTVVLGFVILRYLQEDHRTVRWLTESERSRLGALLDAEAPPAGHTKLREVFRSPMIWMLTGIYFSYNFALYGISFWLPNLIRDLGVDGDVTVGLVSALPSLAAIVSMVIFGRSSDRHGERKKHIAAAFALSAVGFVICILAGDQAVLGIIGLMLANAGALSIPAVFWSFQTSMLSGTALAGGIALINSTGNLAGFAAPYAIGAAKDATDSATIALWITAGFMVLGGVLTLTVRTARAHAAAPGRVEAPDLAS